MNLKALDADSTVQYLKSSGAGTDTDPLIVEHSDLAVSALLTIIRDRVAEIAGYTDTLETLLNTLSNYIDTVEALLTTANQASPRNATYINTSTEGTIAAGANSVSIANIGNAAGTVEGVSFPSGATISWSANGKDTLDAIAYNASGTTYLISTVI